MSGIHVALATPVDEVGRLDDDGLHRLLDHVRAGGVTTVCPTGSTGEGPRMTREQRREVIAAVCSYVGDELRVVPAPAGQPAPEVITELQEFAALGAYAALVPTPSYYPMSDVEVARYYRTVIAESPLPLLIYNIPMLTGVTVAPAVVAELASYPNVVGIKDSSRDLEYFQRVVAATTDAEDFAVLTGTDTMLVASSSAGGDGAIAASVNVAPGLSRDIQSAVHTGDWDTAQKAQRQLQQLVGACRTKTLPAGWKAALEHIGICRRLLVPPAECLDEGQFTDLRTTLDGLGWQG